MEENPLDLEQHEEESLWDVWKRRLMFTLLIGLCISFAAPAFSSCSGAFGSSATELAGSFRVGDRTVEVSNTEFGSTWQRLSSLQNLQRDPTTGRAPPPLEREDVWRHIMLNAAAVEAGVHVPDSRIGEMLASSPLFQRDGKFSEDQYRTMLRTLTDNRLTDRDLTRSLAELIRIGTYQGVYRSAFGVWPSQDAFESWRDNNEKVTATYVVQPYAPLEEAMAGVEPTDAELAAFAKLPVAQNVLRVGARKTVEAAYFLVRDMTEEQMKEIVNVLQDGGHLEDNLVALGLNVYFDGRDSIYTRENWLRDARAKYAMAKDAHDAWLKDWEAQPEETREPKRSPPPDPTLDTVPEDFQERYEKFWRQRIEREVLAREFLKVFAERAEREGRSFADLAQEYEVLGVRVAVNGTPLADNEFAEQFPEDLGRDSELASAVRTYLRGPAEERTFTPEVHTEPIPTTRLGQSLDDRGFMVLRLAGFEPSHVRDVSEARDEVTALWREHQVEKQAREKLEAVRAKVESGDATLEAAAVDAGLEVRTLRRFNRSTAERRLPPAAPGETEDAAIAARREELRYRNRVLEDYATLRRDVEVGTFRSPILLDDDTDAAYLVRVDEKHLPGPAEIPNAALQAGKVGVYREVDAQISKQLSYEELASRFQLELADDDAPGATDSDAESGTDDDAGTDGGESN